MCQDATRQCPALLPCHHQLQPMAVVHCIGGDVTHHKQAQLEADQQRAEQLQVFVLGLVANVIG